MNNLFPCTEVIKYLEALLETGQEIPPPNLPVTQHWTGNKTIPSIWTIVAVHSTQLGSDATQHDQSLSVVLSQILGQDESIC